MQNPERPEKKKNDGSQAVITYTLASAHSHDNHAYQIYEMQACIAMVRPRAVCTLQFPPIMG